MAEASIESTSESSFRLKVTNITKLTNVLSPIHVVQNIPWQMKVFLNDQKANKKTLGISLVCATSDTSQSWSKSASFSFQLMPFNGSKNAVKYISDPQAFNCNIKAIAFSSVIDWCDLNNADKHLVKDDTIQFDININAVDPDDITQSMLIFENTSKCCENDCLADYKLTVVNIKNLMAVRSTQFLLRGLMWDISIYKDFLSHLNIQLGLRTASAKVSCKIQMTTKLMTSKNDKKLIGCVDTKNLKQPQTSLTQKLLNWDKLMDTQNGYVENDAIVLRIEIKVDKPEFLSKIGMNGVKVETTTPPPVQLKMECAICLEPITSQNLSCPPCGHVFCSECLSDTAKKQKICPTCNIAITKSSLLRIFLPM